MADRSLTNAPVIEEILERCRPYLADNRTWAWQKPADLCDVYDDLWARSGDPDQLASQLLEHESFWGHLERAEDLRQVEFAYLGAACLLLRWGLASRSRVLLRMVSSYEGEGIADARRLHELCVGYERQAGEAIQPGIALHDSGQFTRALAVFERAIADYPGATLPLYERAWTAYVAGVGSDAERAAQFDRVRAVAPFYDHAMVDRPTDATLIRACVNPWLHASGGTPGTCARFADAARRLGQWWAAGPAYLRLAHFGVAEAKKHFSSAATATRSAILAQFFADQDVKFGAPPAMTCTMLETQFRSLCNDIAAAKGSSLLAWCFAVDA